MPFIAIVGAGELGAAIARIVAARGNVSEVRLIDDAGNVVSGKALDIQQAAPLENSPTRITASADVTAAAGAAAILLADRIDGQPPTHEWSGESGLSLIQRLAHLDPQAVIICTGRDQHQLLTRGLQELRLSRRRLFGSAPEAASSAVRALVALEADVSPAAVSLTVLGRVPGRIMVAWNDAAIAGRPLSRVLDAAQLARLERRAVAVHHLGPYALASAAAKAVEVLVLESRRVLCCTVGLEGEFGIERAISAVPVVLGPGGISRLIAPPLDTREQVLLENIVLEDNVEPGTKNRRLT